MKKIKETIKTMFLATRYSLGFCLRNSKKLTILRLIIEISITVLLYFSIEFTGRVVNALQDNIGKFESSNSQFLEFIQSNVMSQISWMFGAIALGIILGEFSRYLRKVWFQTLHYSNQLELNDHRSTLDTARFKSKEYDDLSERIQELPTSWQTRIWFSEAMLNLLTIVISFVIFGSALVFYEPKYAIILIVTAIPMAINEFNLVSKWWKLFQELVPKHKKRHVFEKPFHNPNAFVQALMFNQLPSLRKQIKDNTDSVLEKYNSIRRVTLRQSIFTRLISMAGLSLVIIYSAWIIITKEGNIGTYTIIFAAARTFQGNLNSIVSTIADQWNSAKGVILIEKDFLNLKPIVQTPYPVVPKFNLVPTIRFDNVSFAYPDTDLLVLKKVSFVIKPGTKIAIIGQSGHGKSTIGALLMRIYDPTSGGIFAEDVNLKNIEPKDWNNIASALTQEYTILSRTISEEIASSRLDQPVDMSMVINSSKFAIFDEVVALDPNGYDSQIGIEFGGTDFSGGERQRLALARVFYRGTPVLILDEPDAKLDPESAQKVMDQIFALEGVTVIIITHHVSRAERCDNIIVMGRGEVVEQGTHSELMSLGKKYSRMHQVDRERLGYQSSPSE